jgi:hypothetical protein
MKKIKHLMIWMGLLLCLVSCKDAMETIGLGGDEIPAEGVTLNIELPNFSEKKINTRAGADESISKVTAVFYGESNTYKGMANVNIGSKNADGTYQATISNVPSGTKTVHLVTNINDLTEEEAKDLQAAYRKIDTNNPICWGSVSLETLLNGTPTVDLFRPYAKVTLKVDTTVTDFPEKDAGLIINHAAAKSAIAPAGYTEPTDALAETTEFSGTDFGDGTSREVVVTETSAGVANVIIRAKYKGKEGYKVGYYKVGLYKDAKTKKDQYALLRNHNYTITVTKVNDYGFEKLDDAVKSDPENRLEVNVVDDNPAITNMIACKDYELGVSDNLSLKATDTEARITLVTTLKSGTYNVKIKDSDTWIKRYDQEGEGITTPESGRLSSSGKKYLLKFTLVPNPDETPRTGTVTISSGDLKLDVKITQDGFDFMRDPSRQVKMLKNGSEIQPDYFAWLDKDVKGIKPEQMQNVKRNDGLHFTVGKNAYSYKIPKKTGDKLTVDNLTGDVLTDKDGHFTVSADGDYWKVTLADNRDNNYDLWKGTFTIKNADVNITYTVYHTGIFHAITDDMAKKYELAEGGDDELKVKGMFYYGVVKVQGQTQTYIMLDRNLGATDNSPYVPDINEFQKNKGAIGGYFKISEDKNESDVKQGNLSSTLSPEGFEIPDKSVFEDLVNAGTLKTETRKTALGESYYCTFMNTTSSELKTIYLPYGGYLEGESHKYPMHVVFWTKTLVSGTQGFSVKSPEYGFWYNYFDIYNSKKGISNVRFVSGSNGNNTGRYKAMPLRLISKTVLSNPTL